MEFVLKHTPIYDKQEDLIGSEIMSGKSTIRIKTMT